MDTKELAQMLPELLNIITDYVIGRELVQEEYELVVYGKDTAGLEWLNSRFPWLKSQLPRESHGYVVDDGEVKVTTMALLARASDNMVFIPFALELHRPKDRYTLSIDHNHESGMVTDGRSWSDQKFGTPHIAKKEVNRELLAKVKKLH